MIRAVPLTGMKSAWAAGDSWPSYGRDAASCQVLAGVAELGLERQDPNPGAPAREPQETALEDGPTKGPTAWRCVRRWGIEIASCQGRYSRRKDTPGPDGHWQERCQ